MSLPFSTPTIPLQHKIIYSPCKRMSSSLEPKGTRNIIALRHFPGHVLKVWHVTLRVGKLSPPTPAHQAILGRLRTERCQGAWRVLLERRSKTHKQWFLSTQRSSASCLSSVHPKAVSKRLGWSITRPNLRQRVQRWSLNYWVWNANRFSSFTTSYVAFS